MTAVVRPGIATLGPWLIAAAVLAAFWPVLGNGFVWDDLPFIVGNPFVQDAANIPHMLVTGEAHGMGRANPYWRPVTTLTFTADHRLWGDRPAGYHATNLVLHLLASLLVWVLLRRLTDHPAAALGAALLFAVHPAHAEPVSYISARADLLCAVFLVGSLILFLRRLRDGSRTAIVLSVACFAIALLSKVVAIILPALIALHLALRVRRGREFLLLVPYAAVTAGFLVARSLVLHMESWGVDPIGVRLATAGPILAAYVRLALAPFDLRVFYGIERRVDPADATVLASWALVLLLLGLLVVLRRRSPGVSFGGAWFFAGLAPVSGLATILFPAPMADRYLYIPLIGAAVAAGSLADEAIRRRRVAAPLAWIVPATIAVAMLVAVQGRIPAWRDSLSFWRTAAHDAPGSSYVMNALGWSLRDAGRLDEAERALTEAVSLDPGNADAHLNLASIAFLRQDFAAAERHTFRVLAENPSEPIALRYLAVLMERWGNLPLAVAAVRESLRIKPMDASSRALLEQLLLEEARQAASPQVGR